MMTTHPLARRVRAMPGTRFAAEHRRGFDRRGEWQPPEPVPSVGDAVPLRVLGVTLPGMHAVVVSVSLGSTPDGWEAEYEVRSGDPGDGG